MRPPSLISGVGGVILGVPDIEKARAFYTGTWGLEEVSGSTEGRVYLRGTGADLWLLALEEAQECCIVWADLNASSKDAADEVARRLGGDNIACHWVDCAQEPQGGSALAFTDPHGRKIRLRVPGRWEAPTTSLDRPTKITHLVLNSAEAAQDVAWYERIFGIQVIDETVIMFFMNAGQPDHHTLAFAKSDNYALNHIAFEMPTLDAVMRGAGRMRDAGYPIGWGVGRHGPGANVFAYFVGPCGEVIEYTGDVEQVDDSYRVGRPDDWRWPSGRNDRWGVGIGPTDDLKQAQRRVFFAA